MHWTDPWYTLALRPDVEVQGETSWEKWMTEYWKWGGDVCVPVTFLLHWKPMLSNIKRFSSDDFCYVASECLIKNE